VERSHNKPVELDPLYDVELDTLVVPRDDGDGLGGWISVVDHQARHIVSKDKIPVGTVVFVSCDCTCWMWVGNGWLMMKS
jgi:hypothetical protein